MEQFQVDLEVLKLISSFATPIVVLLLGIFVTKYLKRLELGAQAASVITLRRLDFYLSTSESLNAVYCYFLHIGTWRAHTPSDIVDLKRQLDTAFARALPYVSSKTYRQYLEFHDTCFTTFQGPGSATRLKANLKMHQENFDGDWRSAWNDLFVAPEARSSRSNVHRSYMELLAAFTRDFGLEVDNDLVNQIGRRLRVDLPQDERGAG